MGRLETLGLTSPLPPMDRVRGFLGGGDSPYPCSSCGQTWGRKLRGCERDGPAGPAGRAGTPCSSRTRSTLLLPLIKLLFSLSPLNPPSSDLIPTVIKHPLSCS